MRADRGGGSHGADRDEDEVGGGDAELGGEGVLDEVEVSDDVAMSESEVDDVGACVPCRKQGSFQRRREGRTVLEVDSGGLEVLDDGANDRVVLVERRSSFGR